MLESCHATAGPTKICPPGPSVAIFLATDGPLRTKYGAISGPTLPQMVPSLKSCRLVYGDPPCLPSILQSSVSCIHVSVRWLR